MSLAYNDLYGHIAAFLDAWDTIKSAEFKKQGYAYPGNEVMVLLHGRKYLRVVMLVNGEVHQVEAFIDETTGDIYKPDSWTRPAKHVRGNVFSPEHGAEAIGPGGWGIRYLR